MPTSLEKKQIKALAGVGISEKMLSESKSINFKQKVGMHKSILDFLKSNATENADLKKFKDCEYLFNNRKSLCGMTPKFMSEFEKCVKKTKITSFHNLFKFLKAYNKGEDTGKLEKALVLYCKDLPSNMNKYKDTLLSSFSMTSTDVKLVEELKKYSDDLKLKFKAASGLSADCFDKDKLDVFAGLSQIFGGKDDNFLSKIVGHVNKIPLLNDQISNGKNQISDFGYLEATYWRKSDYKIGVGNYKLNVVESKIKKLPANFDPDTSFKAYYQLKHNYLETQISYLNECLSMLKEIRDVMPTSHESKAANSAISSINKYLDNGVKLVTERKQHAENELAGLPSQISETINGYKEKVEKYNHEKAK